MPSDQHQDLRYVSQPPAHSTNHQDTGVRGTGLYTRARHTPRYENISPRWIYGINLGLGRGVYLSVSWVTMRQEPSSATNERRYAWRARTTNQGFDGVALSQKKAVLLQMISGEFVRANCLAPLNSA
jgi:hypothetical protein